MRYIFIFIFVALLSSVLLLFQAKEVEITNSICPVMTDEVIDPSIFVIHEGKKVFLCCKKCVQKFNKNPDKYMPNVVITNEKLNLGFARRLTSFIGKLHPMAVHFPIALFFSAIIAFILALQQKNDFFHSAYRFCLIGATIGSIIAVLMGWMAYVTSFYSSELMNTLDNHKIMGMVVMVLLVATTFVNEKYYRTQKKSLKYTNIILMVLAAIAIGITGYWGSTLIHGLGHYSW